MSGWTDGRTTERRTEERTDGQTDRRTDEQTDRQTSDGLRIGGLMSIRTDRLWIDGLMNDRRQTDRWADDGQTDGAVWHKVLVATDV